MIPTGTPQSRRNIKGKGDSFISDSQSNAKSKVTLRRGPEEYTKSYDGKNRKTLCELNGMKITMKAVVGNLRDDVRFWSSDSLSFLDPGPEGFVNYVDKNLCDRGNSLLLKAEVAYNVWIESHGKLSELRYLQIRKEGNDEMDSFSEHLESVSLFELKLQKVLSEAFYILNEINDALYDGTTSSEEGGRPEHDGSSTSINPSSKISPTSTKSASATVSIEELLKKIQGSLSDSFLSSTSSASSSSSTSSSNHYDGGVTVHEYNESPGLASDSDHSNSDDSISVSSSAAMIAWDVALLTEDFLSNLSTTLDGTLFSIDNIMSSANSNSNTVNSNKVRNKDSLSGKDSDFNTMINTIGEQGNKIIILQTEFEKLNLKNTNFNEKMENLHNYFQAIEFNMIKVKKEILDMRNSLPILKINDVIGKFQALVTESEKLCKRHGVRTYSDLQVESRKWKNDLILMENLIYTLPASEKHEYKLRKEYTEIALDLTEMRLLGAHQFINRVNNVLPELEMGDKSIGVNFLMLAGTGRDSTGYGTGTGVISNSNGMSSNRDEGAEDYGDLERAFHNWKESFFHISDTEIRIEDSQSKTPPAEFAEDNSSGKGIENKQGESIAVGVGASDVEGVSVSDKVIDKEKHDELKKELASKLAESLSPIGGATGKGWDDIALSVRTCRKKVTRKGDGEVEERVVNVHDPIPIPIPMVTPMSSLIHLDLRSLKVLSSDDDLAAYWKKSSEVGVLSSGESTRLALAMETCTHTAPVISSATEPSPSLLLGGQGFLFDSPGQGGEDAVNGQLNRKEGQEIGFVIGDGVRGNVGEKEKVKGKVKGRSFEGLLILDEIDAHIGGEPSSPFCSLLLYCNHVRLLTPDHFLCVNTSE